MQEKDREKAICLKTAGADAESRVLVMTDGAEELGHVVISLRESVLYIHGFDLGGKTDFSTCFFAIEFYKSVSVACRRLCITDKITSACI